ncbi:DUF1127 domain-containing protein [Bauldia litoralis]|uniref:DUF1127 domain-containing protein n=1 Tax=Bauldia litoralis TaxID=665467 RepID=A0A1G6BII7_9HYPH|nr:DUF1127 domain-containing protein [Bauldia litoralis]SDB20403.1 protein of unknown function [Bauldia litoralis]
MSIQSFTADTLNNGWNLAEVAGSIMERLSTRWAVRMRRRTVRNKLLDYSPQQLAELGISEDDIDFVAEDFYRG